MQLLPSVIQENLKVAHVATVLGKGPSPKTRSANGSMTTFHKKRLLFMCLHLKHMIDQLWIMTMVHHHCVRVK